MSESESSYVELEKKYDAQLGELKSRLTVDPAKLTEALIEQPTLSLAARELVVDCIALRDKYKQNLDVYASGLDAQVRENAVNAKEKLTEARIAAMVSTDSGVIGWKYSVIDANALVGRAQALAESYSQRSWMLRELAQIHGPFERDRFGDGLASP